ncbi:MAG: NAD(P)H-binding protein [Rhizobiaceae bacterium]
MTSNSRNKTIAILGAGGRLGSEAVTAFHAAGWSVTAITRHGKGRFPQGVRQVACDALDQASVIRACAGNAHIFNGLNPIYTRWRRQLPVLTENVLAAAKAAGAVHLFPGNVYNFGSQIPPHPTEDTPQVGDHAKARLRIEAEERFREAAKGQAIQTLIIRAGDFYGGKGTGSWFDLVIAAGIGKGKFTYPGAMDIVHAWAYLPDLARAFVALAENSQTCAMFDRFHFEGHSVSGTQMKEAAERATGGHLKAGSLPWPVLRIGGLFWPMWRETWEVSYLWRRPHQLSDEKLTAVTGRLPSTAFSQAIRQALFDLGHLAQAEQQGVAPSAARASGNG